MDSAFMTIRLVSKFYMVGNVKEASEPVTVLASGNRMICSYS